MTTKLVPTFFLKGVSPSEVLEKYKKGLFGQEVVLKKITVVNGSILLPNYGQTNHSAIYSLKDRNNNNVILATSNHKNFEVKKNNFQAPFCRTCFKENKNKDFMGIILKMEEKLVLIDNEIRVFYVFHSESEDYCTFECTLEAIRKGTEIPASYRDITLMECERYLKFLFSLIYPDKILRCTQDPRLLIKNNGSLSEEDHNNVRHIFKRTERIVLLPVKTEYLQSNFQKPNVTLIPFNKK